MAGVRQTKPGPGYGGSGSDPGEQEQARATEEALEIVAQAAESTKVNIIFGAVDLQMDVSGFTIEEVVDSLGDVLGLNETEQKAECYLNGAPVNREKKLQAGDRLEFHKEAGQKGQNRVTIFSNGMADFTRVFSPEQTEVSLPVRKEHIGDVLASLSVFGQVKLTQPPSFTPENELEGKLKIDGENVDLGLARSLVGAQVSVTKPGSIIEGTLCGVTSHQDATGGEAITKYSYVVLTKEGLRKIPLSYEIVIAFTDPMVKEEIQKALRRRFEAIQPNSTTVNLKTDAKGSYTVQYTVPAAAWKMSYRLRKTPKGIVFSGFAIVDNNTEEDWKDFQISCVVGEPITFKTDLAESKLPRRNVVNLVRDKAQGGFVSAAGARPARAATLAARGTTLLDDDAISLQQMASGDAEICSVESAFDYESEVTEVGDFSVFEYEHPVTINSGESITLPMFEQTFDKAKDVLYYNRNRHPERPWKSVEFTNQTGHALDQGVCTVYENGVYAGTCILPSMAKNEDRLVHHALDTSVRVSEKQTDYDNRNVAIRVSKGVGYVEQRRKAIQVYQFESSSDEVKNVVVDHSLIYAGPKAVSQCTLETNGNPETLFPVKEIGSGRRYEFAFTGNAHLTIEQYEISSQKYHISANWLSDILEGFDFQSPGVQKLVELQKLVDEMDVEIEKTESKTEDWLSRQSRVMELLKSDPDNSTWKTDLTTIEEGIREIEDVKLPELRTKKDELEKAVAKALEELTFEWSEEGHVLEGSDA